MKRKTEPTNTRKKRKITNTKAGKGYKNDETFAYGTAVNEIPKKRLLVLDDYAFDIEELDQLEEKDLFTNMHTQSEFSEEAKQTLASCRALRDKVQRLLSKTVLSESLMKSVYDLAITLLKYGDSKESEEALYNFQLLLDSHPKEKNALLNFVIQMAVYNPRARTDILSKMTFGKIYSQLSDGDFCVRAAGNWFVQAVRMTYPAMVNEEEVKILNKQGIQAQMFTFFVQNRVTATQFNPIQAPGTMQRELDEIMKKTKENQEELLKIVNSL
ncbi:hypothetical protein ACQUW5_07995 [Legionella sp. CNM-1927-20]|uniref:hypothetical protein n=1 Tax=Legionella sp. CNM-1927-20 TaxID=3422221 RepID=UPI00403AA676